MDKLFKGLRSSSSLNLLHIHADNAASCDEAGGSHAQGDSWYQDPCTICICQRGVVHCSKVQCSTLQPMSGCQLILIRNACCPLRVCRDGGELSPVTQQNIEVMFIATSFL